MKNVGTDPGVATAFGRQLALKRCRESVPTFFKNRLKFASSNTPISSELILLTLYWDF